MHLNGGQRIQEYHQLCAVFPSLSNKIILQLTVSHLQFISHFDFGRFLQTFPQRSKAFDHQPRHGHGAQRGGGDHPLQASAPQPAGAGGAPGPDEAAGCRAPAERHARVVAFGRGQPCEKRNAVLECLGMMGNEGSWLS